MQNNLLSIFKAITPDNIKNIKLIEDSMRIFIELLNENSPMSSDIKKVLSEQTTNIISDELIKIYLWDYYSLVQNLKNNKTIGNKFKAWNDILKPSLYPVGLPYIGNSLYINYFTVGEPGGVLSDTSDDVSDFNANPFAVKLQTLEDNLLQNKAENYYVNRLFKQSKGLKKGINFIYDVLNEHLVASNDQLDLIIQETGNPFELNITGSLDKDIYKESVAYLSHPLGFVYDYTYINETRFYDNYSLLETYIINTLEVRCLSGNVEAYSLEVNNIIDTENYLRITFIDGSYLLQENNIVKYFASNDDIIKLYPSGNHCSIYVDYEVIYASKLTEQYIIRENSVLADESYPSELISETQSFLENKKFLNGMLINDESIIGSELITDDSEQYESVKTKDESNLEDSAVQSGSESYDISLVTEDFVIERIVNGV